METKATFEDLDPRPDTRVKKLGPMATASACGSVPSGVRPEVRSLQSGWGGEVLAIAPVTDSYTSDHWMAGIG